MRPVLEDFCRSSGKRKAAAVHNWILHYAFLDFVLFAVDPLCVSVFDLLLCFGQVVGIYLLGRRVLSEGAALGPKTLSVAITFWLVGAITVLLWPTGVVARIGRRITIISV